MTSIWEARAKENRAFADKRKAAKDAGLPPPVAQSQKPRVGLPAAGFGNGNAGNNIGAGGGGAPRGFGFQARGNPSVVPVPLREFSYAEVQHGAKTTGQAQLIPLRNPTNGPVVTSLTGGGTIPFQIGLQTSDSYGKSKTRMTFTMDDPEERKAMDRIHRDATAYIMNIADKLYPGITEFDYTTLVGRVLSEVKAKKDGGEWPQLASVNVAPESLYSEDSRTAPLLQIVNETTQKSVLNLPDILGQRWTGITIEWQYLVVGWHENKETKVKLPLISISRRLRGHMYLKVDENQYHLVLPENRLNHDASECKMKHVKPEPISTVRLKTHARISEVKAKDQTHSARIEHMEGGNLVIKLMGGGSIPPFCLDTNQQNNLVLTVSVDTIEDEMGLDQLSSDLQTLALERRDEYFFKSTKSDETLRDCIKMILAPKTPESTAAGFSRSFGCIFEFEKLGTTCSIIDSTGRRISSPDEIRGKKWKEYWFTLRCTYVKKVAQLFEVGFSKRFVHMELQPDMEAFVVQDERRLLAPAATTPSPQGTPAGGAGVTSPSSSSSSTNDAAPPLEPDPKRSRVQ